MRKPRLILFCVILLAFPVIISLIVRHTNNAHAQVCCFPPQGAPLTPKWSQGASVTVAISTQFTSDEKNDIVQAFEAWNSSQNCAGVSFHGFASSDTAPHLR